MNKYKKIFSGLGLLSISTLIGASVVACAKKPSPKDSSTEATDQNNNQGHSTTPEQGKPEMPQNPAPDAPSTPTPEMPKDTPEQNGNTGQSNDSKNNTQDQNKGEAGKNDSKQENKPTPQPQPKETVEQKSNALLAEIEKNPGYPSKTAPALQKLKDEVESIKKETNKTNEEKLASLVTFETKLNKIKEALEKVTKDIDALKYPNVNLTKGKETSAKAKFKEKLNDKATAEEISKVLPNGWTNKIEKYNEVFKLLDNFLDKGRINSLLKRFEQTDENGKVTQPLTDKDVEILLVHTDENGRRYPLKPKKPKITIPGLHKQQDNKNQKPKVAVEIAEWWSDSSEKLKIKDNLKVFVKGNLSPEIKKILDEFKKDYKALFNKELSYQSFDKDAELKNNVILDLSNKNINGFDNETYKMSIEDNVIITATHKTGANWATRTFLQMLLLDKDFSIPKGIMKDYPKYKVRG
ncbi:glycoside hydrolase family 20 zincin-like fold domain-containing protein, partial [Mycoplasmopsis cynos]|uniref:glycoside hydrolase family 20 zincin-like fold domain-containing protein n=1 Tax=Mycoplasmopsis cynos TaxID=171284 RepID=UPI002805E525